MICLCPYISFWTLHKYILFSVQLRNRMIERLWWMSGIQAGSTLEFSKSYYWFLRHSTVCAVIPNASPSSPSFFYMQCLLLFIGGQIWLAMHNSSLLQISVFLKQIIKHYGKHYGKRKDWERVFRSRNRMKLNEMTSYLNIRFAWNFLGKNDIDLEDRIEPAVFPW